MAVTTILYTDLVGSTELMQRAGEERARGVFEAHRQLLGDAVTASGGTELQWLGDGVLAAFASPADAVRASIAIQQSASRRSSEGELALRIGIDVSELMEQEARGTGSGFFGSALVIAKRLCDLAEPGQILCSSTISALLRGRQAFRFRELGARTLKGIAEPAQVCEVLFEREAAGAFLSRTPFVGRSPELARIEARLAEARAGRGGLIMLTGEPGIGKTRALEELAQRARASGAIVLAGACYESDVAPPFGPFAEVMADHAKRANLLELEKDLGPYAGALAAIAPALRERLPGIPQPVAISPDEERWRLLDAVVQFLLALAQRAPLLLVLDDLHWADRGTIALLRHVARAARRGRVLVVGAYRDVELDRVHPLAEALAGMRREVEYERIALRGLAPGEVAELLAALAARDLPAEFVEVLNAEADGNPFFIREILLHLVEAGRVFREDGRWTTRLSIEELGVPEGVRQVIGRRLSRLSGEANRLLTTASAFGGAFRFDVAARAAELADAVALDALDEALEAQLVRSSGAAETYDFTHALIRHTLYGEQNASRQVRLHRRLADAMEQTYGEYAGARSAEIAQQYARSAALPGAERGVAHALVAAERGEAAAGHEETVAFLRLALELALADDPRRPRLLARLGLALAWSRAPDEAVRVASDAAELLATAEGSDAAADYLMEASSAVFGASFSPLAWQLATQGLRHIAARRDFTWARLMNAELMRRVAMDPELPGIPLPTPEQEQINRVLLATPEWATRAKDEMLVAFMMKPHSRAEVLALPFIPSVKHSYATGEYRRALQQLTSELERELERGRLAVAAVKCGQCASLELALGNVASADDWYARAVELAERVGNPPFVVIQLSAAPFERMRVRGERFGEMAASAQQFIHQPAPENRWSFAAMLASAAYSSAEAGLREPALQHAATALPAIDRAAAWEDNYPFLAFWTAAAYWQLEHPEHAALLERNLREKCLASDLRYVSTDARLALAWMCALQGRCDEASAWFAKARAVLDEQGARPLRAITDFDEARMFARRDGAGDRARALALIDVALPRFRAVGMPGWERRAEKLRVDLA